MGDSEHSEHLLVAMADGIGCIRVLHRGTFKTSGALKEFGTVCIDQGVDTIVFDMNACVGMDSTFMGIIAGIGFRLNQKNQGKVVMTGITSRTRSLLSTLGLDQLVEFFMQGEEPEELAALFTEDQTTLTAIEEPEASRKETTELMLEAHSELVHLSPKNHPKFKDVISFLKEDLERTEKNSEKLP